VPGIDLSIEAGAGEIQLMCRDRVVRRASALALTLSTLTLWACAYPQAGPFGSRAAPPPGGALVTVENQHVLDMRVYLIRGVTPIALGSVGTLERRTFKLSTSMIGHGGTIRLRADPLGSRVTFTSDVIPAAPGDHVSWTLAPSLTLSYFSVRHIVGGV
jgi:hypothetical protein